MLDLARLAQRRQVAIVAVFLSRPACDRAIKTPTKRGELVGRRPPRLGTAIAPDSVVKVAPLAFTRNADGTLRWETR